MRNPHLARDGDAAIRKQSLTRGTCCNPRNYVRPRPPSHREVSKCQQANHVALVRLERYLKALTAYRYRLDNPGVHRA